MAKTYQDIVTEARVLLQDTEESSERYSDADLLAILNRGLRSLATIRPDACYDLFSANALAVPEIVESSPGAGQTVWTDSFNLDFQFFGPLVHYVVGVAEIVDDEYTTDGRAALLLNEFKRSLMGL